MFFSTRVFLMCTFFIFFVQGIEESELLDVDIKPHIKSSVDTHAVSLLTRLKSLNGDYVVTVANIHVAYDKFKRQDKQCLQVRRLIRVRFGKVFNSWMFSSRKYIWHS